MATELRQSELDRAFATVRKLVGAGVPFEHVEAYIAYAGLDEEMESMLWLYAWCEGDAKGLRDIVTAGDATT
ncbi:MAG: hypothetical protein ACJ780_10385 [Solirubrobacteraceae bacterium]|jgi:hypothetical protein